MNIRLGNVCSFLNGGTPSRSVPSYFEGNIPWITGADISGLVVQSARSFITEEAISNSATNRVPEGTVLLVTRTSVGKVAIAGMELCFSQDITALKPDLKKLDVAYLVHFLRTKETDFNRQARGATIKGVTRNVIESLEIALPSIAEQKRIATILDKAEELRGLRRKALEQLDAIAQSIFLEMFGNPATNPKGWKTRPLVELTKKFSDGPFGSNLKTSHYTETGVRVVRLQNIGIGEFINNDCAYVAPEHFATLKKHECRPGDVLVATLGDPNLRACIQPSWLSIALNKADCVQARPDPNVANAEYLCALLNQPATEQMAHDLILGQTRLRISMGRLRNLMIPTPPIALQQEFARQIEAIEQLKVTHRESLVQLDALFVSLQHRAFRGEL